MLTRLNKSVMMLCLLLIYRLSGPSSHFELFELPHFQKKDLQGLFSNLRTFTQAGITSTGGAPSIGVSFLQTSNNTVEKVNPEQMQPAPRLFHTVIF